MWGRKTQAWFGWSDNYALSVWLISCFHPVLAWFVGSKIVCRVGWRHVVRAHRRAQTCGCVTDRVSDVWYGTGHWEKEQLSLWACGPMVPATAL